MQTCGHKENAIEIHPDYARSLLVIDPDHRELWISLGCALENLAVAARASGYAPEVTYPEQSDFIHVRLTPDAPQGGALFDAIPLRQNTRSEYDGQPVKTADLDQVQALPLEPGVALRFITTPTEMETILDYGLRSGVMTLPSSATSRHARVIRVPEAHEPLAIQPAPSPPGARCAGC